MEKKTDIQDIYPLSYMQKGMLFASLMNPDSNSYFQQAEFTIKGALDPEIFQKSWDLMLARYDIFRTVFLHQGIAEPKQVVLKERTAPIGFEDISGLPEAAADERVRQLKEADRRRGFDLSKDVLMRATVIRTGETAYRCIWSHHHILMDGWCLGVVIKEFFEAYRSLALREPVRLPPARPYSDYIRWLTGQEPSAADAYWENYLEGYGQSVSPLGFGTGGGEEYSQETHAFRLDEVSTFGLAEIARLNRVTLNTVFQTVWGLLLHIYNHTTDAVFGSVVSGRPLSLTGADRMIGLFINTVPVRVRAEGQTFAELAGEVQRQAIESEEHVYYPLYDIQSKSELRGALLTHLVAFENYPVPETGSKREEAGLAVQDFRVTEQTHYDFDVTVMPGRELFVKFSYNANVYDRAAVARIEGHLRKAIGGILENPDMPIADLDIVGEEERHILLERFNGTDADFPRQPLHRLFEEQASRKPDRTAVVCADRSYTYRGLDEDANRLAAFLSARPYMEPESRTVILIEPSLERSAAILGVLKSGGAYVPVDPDTPEERIRAIIADSGAKAVLAGRRHVHLLRLSMDECPELSLVVCLDHDVFPPGILPEPKAGLELAGWSGIAACPPARIDRHVGAERLAYVIYTSGTTGKPKGVMIEHQSAANLSSWHIRHYDLRQEDRCALFAGFGFDASVWEFFPPLLAGAAVVFAPSGAGTDLMRLRGFYESERITAGFLPTPVCEQFLELGGTSSLRLLLTGGDRLRHFRPQPYRVVNNYGPTENAVVATSFDVTAASPSIPIGRPIDNVRAFVLRDGAKLQPIGAPGELCIAGEGLARGYWNEPDLTAAAFVRHPFERERRIYRTGDLVRWLPDGNLEYMGRLDQQVKIRGYRVELGEIESRLLQLDGIRDAAAVIKEAAQGDKEIWAYVVSDREMAESELRGGLSGSLPAYMIPARFALVSALPLTPNGKVDRKALESRAERPRASGRYLPPRSPLEEKLAAIWQEVLGVDRVGIEDHFFELGGDSIKGIKLQSRLYKERMKAEMRDLFRYPTIARLVPFVQIMDARPQAEGAEGEGALIPAQQVYFSGAKEADRPWHRWTRLYRAAGFDEMLARQAWSQLLVRHDALRTVFRREGDRIVPWVHGASGPSFKFVTADCGNADGELLRRLMDEEIGKICASFRPEQGPLAVAALFKTARGDQLWIVVHGLIADGASLQILQKDFLSAYDCALQGASLPPSASVSFQSWTKRLRPNAPRRKPARNFVRLGRPAHAATLPAAIPGREASDREPSVVTAALPAEETERLLGQAQRAYHTELPDLLLTAWGLCLAEWMDVPEAEFSADVEVSRREEETADGFADTLGTVGCMTAWHTVRLQVRRDREPGDTLISVKEMLRQYTRHSAGEYSLHTDDAESPEVCFGDWGRFDSIGADNGAVVMGAYADTAALRRDYRLKINRVIIDGRLRFLFEYRKAQFDRSAIERLVALFMDHMRKLSAHCLQRETAVRTPSDLGTTEMTMDELEQWGAELAHLEPESGIERIYPLSPLQEGMLFHARLDPDSAAYFDQMSLELRGSLDIGLFERSFNDLLARHDSLRTVFRYAAGMRPLQAVLSRRRVPVRFEDLQGMSAAEQAEHMEAYKREDRERRFDLARDVLIRFAVFRTGARSYELVWSYHHLILDGWCLGILIREFFHVYEALSRNEEASLPEAQPYGKFIRWLETRDKDAAAGYWDRYLDAYEGQADIIMPNGKRNNVASAPYLWKSLEFEMDKGMTRTLEEIAGRQRVTLNTLLQAAWGLLLAKYNHATDVVFGTIVSGRPPELDGAETMVGLFINTIPVRIRMNSSLTFAELLQEVQRRALESAAYDWFPLAEMKSERIRHLFVFENYPIERRAAEGGGSGLEIADARLFEQTNYDFNLLALPGDDELRFKMTFNASAFDEADLQRVWQHLLQLLRGIAARPEARLDQLKMLGPEEVERVTAFNATACDYPREMTIDRLITDRAARTGGRIAMEHGTKTLTYGELAAQSEQWALALAAAGVGRGDRVGLIVRRGFGTAVGMLAIMRAGAAYVPIDPDYPAERQRQLAAQSGLRAVLTDSQPAFDGTGMAVVRLDMAAPEGWPNAALPPERSAEDLAYVIYTSGSTGLPKGVMIEHRSAVNLIYVMNETHGVGEGDRLLWMTSMCFDLSVYDLFGTLAAGGTVIVAEKEQVQDPRQLWELLSECKITIWDSVPTTMQYLVLHLEEQGRTEQHDGLRLVLLSGDWIPVSQKDRLQAYFPQAKVVALGGATEAAVWSNRYLIEKVEDGQISIPYGKPIGNNEFYILDPFGEPTPWGIAGELHIGGIGVAKGYLNDEAKTRESFPPNPFRPSELMYRTGDLGRLLPDGNMEFLGRKDFQVKVRGYRIEVGEIEYQLMRHESVREAVVIAASDASGAAQLTAYVVPEGSGEVAEHVLRLYLKKQLPEYMMPSQVKCREQIPLSANGKIDRKALLSGTGGSSPAETVPPRTATERAVSAIWGDLLGLKPPGIREDFFAIGGHSLLAASMATRIEAELGVELPLPLVFRYPTIEDLADKIDRLRQLRGEQDLPVSLLKDGGEGSRRIFCFPPIAGYGFEYRGLAEKLPAYTWYAFDFIPEGDDGNRAGRYAGFIRELQPEGPYTLLGYSAGGNVAYEVARELESAGQLVAELFILDAARKTEAAVQTDSELERMTEEQLAAAESEYGDLLAVPSVRKDAAGRMTAYRRYLNGLVNASPIRADIRILLAERSSVGPSWTNSTSGKLTMHQGYGSHLDMLAGRAGNENARVLRELFSQTEVG